MSCIVDCSVWQKDKYIVKDGHDQRMNDRMNGLKFVQSVNQLTNQSMIVLRNQSSSEAVTQYDHAVSE